MENFKKLQHQNQGLAKILLECSRDELLDLFALEVAEKEELADFKQTYDDATTDFECISNFAIQWLKKNKKGNNHHLYIDNKTAKLIYTNTEREVK